jgi:uncharacterized protein YdhG (YjbR/CyaY superfamily)
MKVDFNSVEEYIQTFPEDQHSVLNKVRETILKNSPGAVESISYGMPAYKLNGKPLVYFALYKSHLGFYATPSGHSEFETELAQYKQGKGSVQFPLNKAIPYDLITRIVKFRVAGNEAKK